MQARVQTTPFDLGAELAGFGHGAGAVVSFTGLVRDEGGKLSGLEIEHYPGMTERSLEAFGTAAAQRFDLTEWKIIHRTGPMLAGEQIMMVATAARHRKAAFDAAEYLMDWLKSRAPFWKREIRADGTPGDWVDAAEKDEAALSRW